MAEMIELRLLTRYDGHGVPSHTVWMGDHYVDGQPDPNLVDLFGTHSIPLPFTGLVDAKDVQKELALRYPHARVVVLSELP